MDTNAVKSEHIHEEALALGQDVPISGGTWDNEGPESTEQDTRGKVSIKHGEPNQLPSSQSDPQQEHHESLLLLGFVRSSLERQHIHRHRPYPVRGFPQLMSVQNGNGNAEAYSRSLLLSENGFPVWYPGGDLGKSVEYLQKGLSIEDVGILDGEGALDLRFNMFLPLDDHIHSHSVPCEFQPIHPPPISSEISCLPDYFKPGNVVTSKGVQATVHAKDPQDISFTSIEKEGGILVLPQGASREDLISTDRFHDFSRKNAPHWYQVVNGYDGVFSREDLTSTDHQLVSVQRSNGNAEAYSRSLLLSGNEFPVWYPGGELGKSAEYLRKGLGIGDVGPSKAMSQQSWVGRQPPALSHRQSCSDCKDKESVRSSAQQSSGRQDGQIRGTDDGQGLVGSYRGEAGGGISGHSSDSQSRSGNEEKENARSLGKQSSSRSDPRVRETDADYGTSGQGSVGGYRGTASGGTSGQSQLWTGKLAPGLAPSSTQQPSGRQPDYTPGGSNRNLYAERDNPGSTFATTMMGTTEYSSRSPPNQTSAPQRQEHSPPYNTRGSGWGSSQSADPSRTTLYGAFPPTRPPQHEAKYSHPSQVQRSLGSQRPKNAWDGGSSRPSGGQDSSSNPYAGTTGSHSWGGQPTGTPPEWSAHPPHPDSIVTPPTRVTQSYPSSQQTSPHGSADGEGDKSPSIWPCLCLKISLSEARSFTTTSTHPGMQRTLADIVEVQVCNPSQQTLSYNSPKIQALGTPFLSPFLKGKGNENLGLSENGDGHTLLYMRSDIIGPDTIAFWFPAPTLFPPSGGRRGVQLGDLGYFDDSGEFHPIFNIFHSYEQNIAEGARPPSQPYQHLYIDRNSIRQVDIQRQQTYTSSNIEKRGEAGPHSQNSYYKFRTYKRSGRNGAIIVLPHGGSSSCIRNAYFHLPEVKRHFREHAPSWYQHALQYMPKQTNGSLILVRATYCARSWGIAAFASKRDIREPLTATFMSNSANEYQHIWHTNDGKWKTSTGPSSEELRELGGREPPLNQCIGVAISSLRLDDITWQVNFGSLSGPSARGGGWGLRRVMSRDRSTIHVDNLGKRGLLDSIIGRPRELRHASYGNGDYTLLPHGP